MKTMTVSKFKAEALRVIRDVTKTREPVVVTKRGRPVAEVIPYDDPEENAEPGELADTLVFEKDIVSPVAESDWDANR